MAPIAFLCGLVSIAARQQGQGVPDNKLLEAALQWADAGFSVFPCVAGDKRPATPNGLYDATTDPEIIRRWWSLDHYNIGVAPAQSGCFVLDVDMPLGRDSLAELEKDHGALPETLTIRTPRGGLHYWFTGECPSTVQKLGPKLDTRGTGGYVLVPPSSVNGASYDYESSEDTIARAPDWIAANCSVDERERVASTEDARLDTPSNVERARHLLQRYRAEGRVAIEGSGGDDLTYRVAAEVLNLGLSPEKAWETLLAEWNPHCIPPWSEDELGVKVHNASAYMQNDAGAWAVPPAEETFAHLIPKPVRSKFYPLDESEQDALPDPTWLVPNLLPDDAIAMWYGPSGSFKSYLALDLCMTLAAGLPGWKAGAQEPMPVVYIAAEGLRALAKARRKSWKQAREIQGPLPFYAVATMPTAKRPEQIIEAVEAIQARGIAPRLVVIDTQARAMAGMNENDAEDAGIFIEAIETMKRSLGCTVLVIHHTGNDVSRPRGSSALYAGYDTVVEVQRDERSLYASVHVRKQKDADEAATAWAFKGDVVGTSLVFSECDARSGHGLTNKHDLLHQVGAALRSLDAIGTDRAVTQNVLAQHLTPSLQGDSEADTAAAVAKTMTALGSGAKQKLAGYTDGRGRWYLPHDSKMPEPENRSEEF
jgi:hypothetical protein